MVSNELKSGHEMSVLKVQMDQHVVSFEPDQPAFGQRNFRIESKDPTVVILKHLSKKKYHSWISTFNTDQISPGIRYYGQKLTVQLLN